MARPAISDAVAEKINEIPERMIDAYDLDTVEVVSIKDGEVLFAGAISEKLRGAEGLSNSVLAAAGLRSLLMVFSCHPQMMLQVVHHYLAATNLYERGEVEQAAVEVSIAANLAEHARAGDGIEDLLHNLSEDQT